MGGVVALRLIWIRAPAIPRRGGGCWERVPASRQLGKFWRGFRALVPSRPGVARLAVTDRPLRVADCGGEHAAETGTGGEGSGAQEYRGQAAAGPHQAPAEREAEGWRRSSPLAAPRACWLILRCIRRGLRSVRQCRVVAIIPMTRTLWEFHWSFEAWRGGEGGGGVAPDSCLLFVVCIVSMRGATPCLGRVSPSSVGEGSGGEAHWVLTLG